MIRRRFLNLVAEDYSTGVRSLHRLDVSKHLFYPSTTQAESENAKEDNNNNGDGGKPPKIRSLRRLPPPIMNLQPFPATDRPRPFDNDTFVLLGPHSSDGKILHVSEDGLHSVVYDADTGSTTTMPSIHRHKGQRRSMFSIAAAAAGPEEKEGGRESLYLMSSYYYNYNHERSFEVLDFNGHPEALPLPPFSSSCGVRSFTTVDGGRTICVSTTGSGNNGTYYFDTRSHEWRKAGEYWTLPFEGGAEYVPELGTWIGLPSYVHEHYLWACSDLSAAMEAAAARRAATSRGDATFILHGAHAPGVDSWLASPLATSQHLWKYLVPPPIESEYIQLRGRLRGHFLWRTRSWSKYSVNLRNLGGGRFCIATVIRDDQTVTFNCEGVTMTEAEFLVLSGVEVVRDGNDDGEGGGGLRMVKHKSKRYMFGSNKIQWVL